MLDYKLIEAFATVIRAGGFEKAAVELHITQSAVSQRIKSLEEQYGRLLLQRTTPPQPTESGTILLTHYTRVKQLENDLAIRRNDSSTDYSTLPIGLNEDSLATWFPKAVNKLIRNENIIVDLHVDDQDTTHELLQNGTVWGCITTKRTALQGCKSVHLGSMTYCMYGSKYFADRHFPSGIDYDSCCTAPMARFNRKDELNKRLFRKLFDDNPPAPPCFYIPSSEKYGEFVLNGHCWGILPKIQVEQMTDHHKFINLCPDQVIDVHLYWHRWTLKSETMEKFDRGFITAAKRLLST
jgi:LysR family transcriptional regulator, chromosome initiation inhibitor